jgi:prepilin-type N-terminal cleavage/methylation domain-containing protein/prepilin-type processing-associated H-X9-DG protein
MRRSGFTLIEMLVVIAIIAVLAAILFPVLSKARAKARQATCASNLKQLAMAVEMYSADWDDMFPGAPNGEGGSGVYGGWIWYGDFDVPHADYFEVAKGALYGYTRNRDIYVCPQDRSRSGCTYELNGLLRWGFIGSVEMPADTILFVPENDHGTANDGYFDLEVGDWPLPDHNDGTNCAFVDGHVKWHAWSREQIHAACRLE